MMLVLTELPLNATALPIMRAAAATATVGNAGRKETSAVPADIRRRDLRIKPITKAVWIIRHIIIAAIYIPHAMTMDLTPITVARFITVPTLILRL